MKLIHTSDLHLGSRMEAKFPAEKATARRNEVRQSFANMIRDAKRNGVSVILLSGDVFDEDIPLRTDKDFFFSCVRENPDIQFLYLRGNHDGKTSYTESLPNLLTFGENWTSYSFDGVTVSGVEITPTNCHSIYSSFKADPGKANIVMLHGALASSPAPDSIVLSQLKNKGIDYLALGHIHAADYGDLDGNGIWAYPGCPEGRGFDEPGEKGYRLLEVEGGKVKSAFIPSCIRTLHEIDCDLSSCSNLFAVVQKVKEAIAAIPAKDLIRLNLVGTIGFPADGLTNAAKTAAESAKDYFFVSVKDKTTVRNEIDDLKGEMSLRGEFVRTVLADQSLSEDEREKILGYGLKALSTDKF